MSGRRSAFGHRPGRTKRTAIHALLERDGDRLIFRVARRLDSPNTWRRHHLSGHKLMTWWLRAFEGALALQRGHLSVAGDKWSQGQAVDPVRPFQVRPKGRHTQRTIPRELRRRVTVIRQVPNTRNFLRDEDDLTYTVKPINDALRNGGFIFDDRREYLEQERPRQEVSTDGHDWTIVIVEPAAADFVPPSTAASMPAPSLSTITEAITRAANRPR